MSSPKCTDPHCSNNQTKEAGFHPLREECPDCLGDYGIPMHGGEPKAIQSLTVPETTTTEWTQAQLEKLVDDAVTATYSNRQPSIIKGDFNFNQRRVIHHLVGEYEYILSDWHDGVIVITYNNGDIDYQQEHEAALVIINNLLAVIHRDNGTVTKREGLACSVTQAIYKVSNLNQLLDATQDIVNKQKTILQVIHSYNNADIQF